MTQLSLLPLKKEIRPIWNDNARTVCDRQVLNGVAIAHLQEFISLSRAESTNWRVTYIHTGGSWKVHRYLCHGVLGELINI